ncbi:MAG TPA: YciI family protein [Ktedonobacteraceae bacterium]|nr:YciI family protein [Ktedonobacteraceae bacterium]
MKFVFIYRAGMVPKDKMETHGKDWYNWLPDINEQAGVRVAHGGKVVSSSGVTDYKDSLGGVSIIEAESLEKAIKIAGKCPGLQYGGDVIVLAEWNENGM